MVFAQSDVVHYNFKLLNKIFRQNHPNAMVIQSVSITILILMGTLVEYSYFRIPAAASIFLLFSIITTIIGAITYWMVEWRILFLLGVVLAISKMMSLGLFSYQKRAFGLNYTVSNSAYSVEVLDSICSKKHGEKSSVRVHRLR